MTFPYYRDEVLLTLSAVDPLTVPQFPNRRVSLSTSTPFITIGRTSKRNLSYEATENNAWIDSAVMSRDHAQVRLDTQTQRLLLKDIGSLHGTFHNKIRLGKNQLQPIKTGDILQFGIGVERGRDNFPPCKMRATVQFGSTRPVEQPAVFRVPDETDVEDVSSDEDGGVQYSSQILLENSILPATPSISQNPPSSIEDETSSAVAHFSPMETSESPEGETAYIDLTESPTLHCDYTVDDVQPISDDFYDRASEMSDSGNTPDAELPEVEKLSFSHPQSSIPSPPETAKMAWNEECAAFYEESYMETDFGFSPRSDPSIPRSIESKESSSGGGGDFAPASYLHTSEPGEIVELESAANVEVAAMEPDKSKSFMNSSDLLVSSAQFLNSPPQEFNEPTTQCFVEELDETSAHQFQASKLILDDNQPTKKRKASEMEEEDENIDIRSSPTSSVMETAVAPIEPDAPVAWLNAATIHQDYIRPVKRFRKIAEAVGYAALGGAAVMSALIATAPSL